MKSIRKKLSGSLPLPLPPRDTAIQWGRQPPRTRYRGARYVPALFCGDNCRHATIEDTDVTRSFNQPLKEEAGFIVTRGNLFDAAIVKTSLVSERYLNNPKKTNAFEGGAVIFDGPEDYHGRAGVIAAPVTN